MPFSDLREFLACLEARNDLKEIRAASVNLEIGAITELAIDLPRRPALLFDEIPGYPTGFRVATNLMNTPSRAALALGLPPEASRRELVQLWRERLRTVKPIPPELVHDGPILQHIEEGPAIDLTKFPAPVWHELDGGPYLGTADMVVMRDPANPDWVNVGAYRAQVLDQQTLGLHVTKGHHGQIIMQHYWERGEPCPVAISVGQDPGTWIASTHNLPAGESEYGYIGWAQGKPVEVVASPRTGLPVPATSELVVEGLIYPEETHHRTEGPFGEWEGYYASGASEEPYVQVQTVLYRDDPIILGAPPLKPAIPDNPQVALDFGAARLWDYLEQAGVPEVRGVARYICGQTSAYYLVISLKQRYPGHARQAAHAALGSYGGALNTRFVILVDEDVDPYNLSDVLWAMGTRCDPATSLDVVRGGWGARLNARIEPWEKARDNLTTGRAIIDACRPWHWRNEFPPVNAMSPQLRERTAARWLAALC